MKEKSEMTPHTIFVHCAATRPDWFAGHPTEAKAAEIKRWHTDPKPKGRGWSDTGYHAIIDRDGTIVMCRPLWRKPAHALGHNDNTLAFCLVGGFGSSENDQFSDHFTPEQNAAARKLIAEWKAAYPTIKRVRGHNEVAAKACPGFKVDQWYKGKAPRKIYQSTTVQAATAIATVATAPAVPELRAAIDTLLGQLGWSTDVTQAVTIVGMAAWINRERIRKFVAGDQ